MSVRCGQELDRRKGKAGGASGRRLVRHNDEPAWKLIKNNATTIKHMRATGAIFRYARSTRNSRRMAQTIPRKGRRLEQAQSLSTDRRNPLHATSRQEDDQTEFLAEPAG